jgi:hypothetical protein
VGRQHGGALLHHRCSSIEPRLRLTGYRAHDLYLGRLGGLCPRAPASPSVGASTAPRRRRARRRPRGSGTPNPRRGSPPGAATGSSPSGGVNSCGVCWTVRTRSMRWVQGVGLVGMAQQVPATVADDHGPLVHLRLPLPARLAVVRDQHAAPGGDGGDGGAGDAGLGRSRGPLGRAPRVLA